MGHCCAPIKIPKVANFHINHTDSQLEVVLTNGQTFSVSQAELEEFLGGNGVTVEDGVAKNLTLKGDVALDQAATASLCEALEDCIEDAITEALKNQPTPKPLTIKSFELLGEQLRITMSDGSTFPVDLSKFTTDAEAAKIADDIKKLITDEHLVSAALNGGTLVMTMKSGKQLNVPLSGLGKDVHLSSGTVQGNNLVLTKSDGTEVTIDLGQFANTQPAVGNTSVAGIVKLNDTLTSTSATEALTAKQGKILQDNKLDKTATAASASKLATARTINLTGDVTGSASFDGSGDVSIVTTLNLVDFANSKTQNGYQKLPNGLIIQWGSYEVTSHPGEAEIGITFPIAFPNSCLNVSATRSMAHHSVDGDGGVLIISTTPTGATFSLQVINSSSIHQLRGFSWLAIGY